MSPGTESRERKSVVLTGRPDECHLKTEAEVRAMQLRAKNAKDCRSLRKLARSKKRFFARVLRGNEDMEHFSSGLQPPELRESLLF